MAAGASTPRNRSRSTAENARSAFLRTRLVRQSEVQQRHSPAAIRSFTHDELGTTLLDSAIERYLLGRHLSFNWQFTTEAGMHTALEIVHRKSVLDATTGGFVGHPGSPKPSPDTLARHQRSHDTGPVLHPSRPDLVDVAR